MKVALLGAGSWGSALTLPLASNGHEVILWCRRPEQARALSDTAHNDAYLSGIKLGCTCATTELAIALEGADLVFITVPSRAVREVCALARPFLPAEAVVISTAKALEGGSHKRMSQVIAEELTVDGERVTALSGPNFSIEVARRLPTATVVAGDREASRRVQQALMTEHLRVYTNTDLLGVEYGGALKNVMALAVGIAEGMHLGLNAQAAIITRGLAEIARLGTRLGAKSETFMGLSGMGDLVLTCTGEYSRNRQAGIAIGQGQSLAGFLAESKLVVEGAYTTEVAWQLAQQEKVDMPITEQVHNILFVGYPVSASLVSIMTRSGKEEWS